MKKRIVSLLLAAICAATLFPSCGEKAPQKSKVDHVYRSRDLGLGDVRTDNILANDKTIIVSGTEMSARLSSLTAATRSSTERTCT